MDEAILFQEKNKPPRWVTFPFVLSLLALLYGVVRQLFFSHPMGSKPLSDMHLIIFTLGYLIFVFFITRLRTEFKMNSEGFYLNTLPLVTENFHRWSQVKEIKMVEFSPLKEFLGVGFRTPLTGMAYIAGKKLAIQITMKGGDKILVAARSHSDLAHLLIDKLQLIKPVSLPKKRSIFQER